jgi:hypothetical protein
MHVTVMRSIQVADIKQLQPEVRAKVDEIVAQTSEDDLQSLPKAIDATPAAVSALKAKGLSSKHVLPSTSPTVSSRFSLRQPKVRDLRYSKARIREPGA